MHLRSSINRVVRILKRYEGLATVHKRRVLCLSTRGWLPDQMIFGHRVVAFVPS